MDEFTPSTRVHVGLGANLDDPVANVRAAVLALHEFIDVRRISSLYRTGPVGLTDQPDFINCVVAGETELTAGELVERFGEIEEGMGRQREVPMGPRTIDLDLLLFGDWQIKEPTVTVPHPRMHERRFVLAPLVEIAPKAEHPRLRKTAVRLLEELPEGEAVQRIEVEDWPPTPERVDEEDGGSEGEVTSTG